MMDYSYVQALVARAKWKKWAMTEEALGLNDEAIQAVCHSTLGTGDTFFMNKQFCAMVDVARHTVPDDLKFEMNWLQEANGFMWLADPFTVPQLVGLAEEMKKRGGRERTVKEMALIDKFQPRVSAIGWMSRKNISHPKPWMTVGTFTDNLAEAEAVTFICFLDYGHGVNFERGFGMWSYFTLQPGETVLERLQNYESRVEKVAAYVQGRDRDELHEIRWVYTAFHIMAQRMAMRVEHHTDRATRRRSERENTPVSPYIKVVTLRRLEEDRPKDSQSNVDWQWQWTVTGHWRNQFLPGSGEHKYTWIDAYVKGPSDKPMKPIPQKVFVAKR